jgi:outer membrane protein
MQNYCVLILFLTGICAAGGNLSEESSAAKLWAGGGVLTLQKPYKGVEAECYALPLVIYQGPKLTLFGPTAAYSLFGEEDRWGVLALARIRTEGFNNNDSRYLNGMSDRDPTVELGLRYLQDFSFAVLSLDFSHDILDKHSGWETRLSLRKTFRDILDIESLNLTPSVGLNWRNKQLNDYYYGVRVSEAAPSRPAYNAGGSVGWLTGLQLNYKLSEKWSFFGLANLEWLDKEITDSPIVEKEYTLSLLGGLLWEF